MDIVTLQAAKAALSTTAANAAILTHRMQQNQEDAVLLVLGDSTGAGTTRWVYLLAQKLAAMFPEYTINYRQWNDTAQAYDALGTASSSAVIQTGTGTHKLDIYNGAFTGSISTYPTTRWTAIAPATPNLVLVNYGHNNTGSVAYRPNHYTLTRQIQERWPVAGLICVGQNPRAATDNGSGYAADRANDLIRQRQVMELCATEGYGFVNVTQRFLNDANYATTLMNADGLHPSDAAGSPAWAAEVARHFKRSPTVVPHAPPARETRIFLPAYLFEAEAAGPVKGLVNTTPAWAFDASTQQGIVAAVAQIPMWWQSWDIYVTWSHATATGLTGGTNGVRWEFGTQNIGPSGLTPLDATSNQVGGVSTNLATGSAHNASGVAYPGEWTLLASNLSSAFRPMSFRLRRVAADAADTLTEAANVQGLLLVRAS